MHDQFFICKWVSYVTWCREKRWTTRDAQIQCWGCTCSFVDLGWLFLWIFIPGLFDLVSGMFDRFFWYIICFAQQHLCQAFSIKIVVVFSPPARWGSLDFIRVATSLWPWREWRTALTAQQLSKKSRNSLRKPKWMRQCRHPFVAPEPKPAFAMELLGISLQEACHNGLIGDEWLRVSFRQGRAKRDPCAFWWLLALPCH